MESILSEKIGKSTEINKEVNELKHYFISRHNQIGKIDNSVVLEILKNIRTFNVGMEVNINYTFRITLILERREKDKLYWKTKFNKD